MKKLKCFVLTFILFSFYLILVNNQGYNSDTGSVTAFSYIPHEPITINDDSDFISYGFPGNGNSTNPYLIEDLNITTTNSRGIYIYGTSKHFVIKNCFVNAEDEGIYVWNVANGTATIRNNTIIDHLEAGIHVKNANHALITENTCKESYKGIKTWYSALNITKNFVEDNLDGIHAYYCSFSNISFNTGINNGVSITTFRSNNVSISSNICALDSYSFSIQICKYLVITNNTLYFNNIHGMEFYASNFSLVYNNTLYMNYYGITVTPSAYYPSVNNTFYFNLFWNNVGEGMFFMSDTANNTIHHNQFVDNNLGDPSQAMDLGNNTWYDKDTNEGNHWSDWIGDGPYQIGGYTNHVDPYPLDEAYFPPLPPPPPLPPISEFSKVMFLVILLIPFSMIIITKKIRKNYKRDF